MIELHRFFGFLLQKGAEKFLVKSSKSKSENQFLNY